MVLIHQKDKNFDHATFPDVQYPKGEQFMLAKNPEREQLLLLSNPERGQFLIAYIGATKIEFHQKLLNS